MTLKVGRNLRAKKSQRLALAFWKVLQQMVG